jgi:TnpA family transposase
VAAGTQPVHITTDHVFALCHLLGYRFVPRLRDLADRRLGTIEPPSAY